MSRVPTPIPTSAPSLESTANPTINPTDGPSPDPTPRPSLQPTLTTWESYCKYINIGISDFSAFSASELKSDTELQDTITNITHYAIAENGVSYGIENDAFSVHFHIVSGALSIVQTMCTATAPTLSVLSLVIESEANAISAEIKDKMITIFLNGTAYDAMIVTINIVEFSDFEDFPCELSVQKSYWFPIGTA